MSTDRTTRPSKRRPAARTGCGGPAEGRSLAGRPRGDRLRTGVRETPATRRADERPDRLVVSELSRLGRSLGQIVTILDALAKAGVAFVALKENIRVDGERDIQTKVMTTLFALFAEVERDLISERTSEGLARAKSSGRKLGRPKGSLGVSRLDGKEDEIRHFLESGRVQDRHRQDHRRVPYRALQLHEHPRAQAEPLTGCLREGARSYAKPDPRHGPPIQEARTFLALLSRSWPCGPT